MMGDLVDPGEGDDDELTPIIVGYCYMCSAYFAMGDLLPLTPSQLSLCTKLVPEWNDKGEDDDEGGMIRMCSFCINTIKDLCTLQGKMDKLKEEMDKVVDTIHGAITARRKKKRGKMEEIRNANVVIKEEPKDGEEEEDLLKDPVEEEEEEEEEQRQNNEEEEDRLIIDEPSSSPDHDQFEGGGEEESNNMKNNRGKGPFDKEQDNKKRKGNNTGELEFLEELQQEIDDNEMDEDSTSTSKEHKNPPNLPRHVVHAPGPPFICLGCPKGIEKHFVYKWSLLEHYRVIHQGIHRYTCDLCDTKFWKKIEYQDHMNTLQHRYKVLAAGGGKEAPPTKKYTCTVCGKVFYNRNYAYTHMTGHQGPIYRCSQCGQGFGSQTKLRVHQFSHEPHSKVKCNECQKDVAVRYLIIHYRLVHQYTDDYIMGKVPDEESRKYQIIVEDIGGSKKGTESVQYQASSSSSHMPLVLELSEQDSPQEGRTSQSKKKKNDHQEVPSSIQPPRKKRGRGRPKAEKPEKDTDSTDASDDKCYCSICDMHFAYKRQKLVHVREVHKGLENYECPECREKFPLKSQMEVHREMHSNVRKFACPVCGRRFKFKGGMQEHMRMYCVPDENLKKRQIEMRKRRLLRYKQRQEELKGRVFENDEMIMGLEQQDEEGDINNGSYDDNDYSIPASLEIKPIVVIEEQDEDYDVNGGEQNGGNSFNPPNRRTPGHTMTLHYA